MNPLRSICPLYVRDERGWPRPIGSGILLAIGSERFVITCAHVIDLIPPGEVLTVYSSINGELRPLRGNGIVAVPPASGRLNDRADVAFFCLAPDIADGLAHQLAFWPINLVALGREATADSHYTFSGYPNRESGPRGRSIIRATPLPITAAAYLDDDYRRAGVSPSTHIGIALHGGQLFRSSGQAWHGTPRFPEMLNGLSGGAIWKNYFRFAQGEQVTPYLIGICMELPVQYPDSFLGIRITAALEGIRTLFPQLSSNIPHDPDVSVSSTIARRTVQS